jgi:hypothetical protein
MLSPSAWCLSFQDVSQCLPPVMYQIAGTVLAQEMFSVKPLPLSGLQKL